MSQNICTMCNGSGKAPNFQKLIDPPIKKYGTMLEHRPQRNEFPRKSCEPVTAMMVACPPTPTVHGASAPSKGGRSTLIQVPCDPPTPCPKFVCEPCPPPSPIKVWLIKSSPMPQKSFCLPMGGGCHAPSPSGTSIGIPILITFPGQPINPIQETPKKEKEKLKPIGRITRNKDMDIIAGKIISKCTCGMRNGLNGDGCPRLSCQNNPGCGMFPPRCWPQFKEPEEPKPMPDQEMICLPIEFVYDNTPKF